MLKREILKIIPSKKKNFKLKNARNTEMILIPLKQENKRKLLWTNVDKKKCGKRLKN